MITTIRSQDEIHERYTAARKKRSDAEACEYLRQLEYDNAPVDAGLDPRDEIEDYRDIDDTAKNFLSVLRRHLDRGRSIRTFINQYVAWKWLLGHRDADSFPGAHALPKGMSENQVYRLLREQIESGEWDRLTRLALKDMKGHLAYL